jgi:hypothetical protein
VLDSQVIEEESGYMVMTYSDNVVQFKPSNAKFVSKGRLMMEDSFLINDLQVITLDQSTP